MWVRDVTGARWLDVDTPESLRFAERTLGPTPESKPPT
jgi:hypothetical protein